ncbi:hypothetical protein, partial [uncultured Lentibacter sp.]|uniref:hypothetical protein n=1 Tax=uncultured Lentibacter sp. TaxID=1659309 RepID=UPI0026017A0C
KTGSFSGTPDDFLPVALAAERSCYAPRFSMWRDTFGSAFKLRPFVRAHLFQQDVVQDFFNEVFEGEAFTLGETPRVNEALSVPELAAMRRVQAVLIARNVAPHLRLSFGGAMGRAMPGTAGRYSEKPQLTQAHGAALWARFSEDAAQTDRLFFDAPALTQAFEQALARAVGPAQDYDAQAYFPARRLRKMEQLAARVADCFEAMPGAWRADYQYLRGQRFVALKDQPDARKRQKNAKQVWALIDKLSKLMVQP